MGIKKPLESGVQSACRDWLRLFGAAVIRVNSGGMKIGKRFVRFNSEPGCSDLLVCLPGGRFAAVEVKRPGRDTTAPKRKAKQEAFRRMVRAAGGLEIVVRSVDELRAALKAEGFDVEGL